ncbi:MAG TPA: regulatory protein RecX [Syntrophales bacterium]|nr:regulatory protein RecX [Syntrophales bacterium]
MANDRPFEKAQQKALRLLSLRSRSKKEMESRLRDKGFDESIVGKVIDNLSGLRYLDDDAFAREWARSLAVNRLYGNRRIERSLGEKGIPRETIKRAIAGVREEFSEEEALATLLKKKLKSRPVAELDRKEKNRLARSLMGKGLPAGKIFEVLRNKEEEIDDGE